MLDRKWAKTLSPILDKLAARAAAEGFRGSPGALPRATGLKVGPDEEVRGPNVVDTVAALIFNTFESFDSLGK